MTGVATLGVIRGWLRPTCRISIELPVVLPDAKMAIIGDNGNPSAFDPQKTQAFRFELCMSAVKDFRFQFGCEQLFVSAHFALADKVAGFEGGLA